jgi:hypothetical protein
MLRLQKYHDYALLRIRSRVVAVNIFIVEHDIHTPRTTALLLDHDGGSMVGRPTNERVRIRSQPAFYFAALIACLHPFSSATYSSHRKTELLTFFSKKSLSFSSSSAISLTSNFSNSPIRVDFRRKTTLVVERAKCADVQSDG